jgi:hypothetical protein
VVVFRHVVGQRPHNLTMIYMSSSEESTRDFTHESCVEYSLKVCESWTGTKFNTGLASLISPPSFSREHEYAAEVFALNTETAQMI